MTNFNTNGFFLVKEFIPGYFAHFLKNYFTLRAQIDPHVYSGDPQVPNCHSVYGDPAFDTVLAMSTGLIERVIGKKLIPQYSYSRIYKKGAILHKHTDRPECEYSVTLSLGGDDKNWPFWIKDSSGNDLEISLDPGDCLVYHGTKLEHWREEYTGTCQYQIFMHYVDADGEFKDRTFDDRPNLGLPADTKDKSKWI
tara:strand:- start:2297 stop:2884 length:588 start_codon:yes stop_codon:yes gene_type:complete